MTLDEKLELISNTAYVIGYVQHGRPLTEMKPGECELVERMKKNMEILKPHKVTWEEANGNEQPKAEATGRVATGS